MQHGIQIEEINIENDDSNVVLEEENDKAERDVDITNENEDSEQMHSKCLLRTLTMISCN